MSTDKPVHVGRHGYPEVSYPPLTPVSVGMEHSEDSVHLLDYWRVIVARRWTVMAVLFSVVAVTVIWTLKETPIFRASVSVQIDRENPNVLSFKDVYEAEATTDDTLRTQFEVLKARTLARHVIQDLHLDRIEEFRPSDTGLIGSYVAALRDLFPSKQPVLDSDPLRPIIDEYMRRLQVAPVRLARIATVTFDSKDPELAARVVNAHANQFIEQNFQYKWDATQKASLFLKEQLNGLKANLEKAEDRLQAYSRENQILFTDQGKNTATEKLQQLEAEHTKAQTDLFAKQSFDRLVQTGHVDALPQITDSQLISGLTVQLAQLRRDDSELSVTFSPDYPQRKRKRSQIEETDRAIAIEKQLITKTIEAEYAAALERETLAAKAVEQQRAVVERINEDIIQYNIIKREVDSDRQLYEGLLTKLNEAGVSADLRASNIRVIDVAEVPTVPVRPRRTLNVMIGLAAGLFFGIGLAFFQDYMDSSIKSVDDVNRYLNIPTLGLIPKLGSIFNKGLYDYGYRYVSKGKNAVASVKTNVKMDLIAHEAPSSVVSEAYRSVRTSLLLSFPDRPPKSVLVTSAVPSEGKTVTAVNMAISLTQMGSRVVIIDCDMRKPRVHSIFDLNEPVGLSNALTGAVNLREAIHPSNVTNLFLIPCGATPPNPSELILSNRFRQMLSVLPQYFDYVVIDSPPIANVSDARILASMCDATILVVKAFSTSRHQASSAVEYLQESRARLAGIVLNDMDVRSAGSYYSYYYSRYSYSNYGRRDAQEQSREG